MSKFERIFERILRTNLKKNSLGSHISNNLMLNIRNYVVYKFFQSHKYYSDIIV